MKFAALLKKELRICLPWLLLSILIFAGAGYLAMKSSILYQQYRINDGYSENYGYYFFTPQSPIMDFGPFISIFSLCLGVILAIQQFFMPGLHRTWSFSIHRAIRPSVIVWSKFAAAAMTFLISLGLVWTLFYMYAAVPGRFYIPVFFKTCMEGWLFILVGLIAYYGTALSAISTTPFYTTRLLGMAIAAIIIFFVYMQTSIVSAILWIIIGAVILIIQIFHTFLTRQY
jgi:hypothetical protein